MKKNDTLYIGHILEAIGKIEKYLNGVESEDFLKSDLLIDATIRELMIVGEATNRLSRSFEQEHAVIPFRDIIGMRNILIHEYTGVDAIFVWQTCKEDLPKLRETLLSFHAQ